MIKEVSIGGQCPEFFAPLIFLETEEGSCSETHYLPFVCVIMINAATWSWSAYLQETAGCRGSELAAFSMLRVRSVQYRQLVRSAPTGAVFCIRSRILGRYMML
jgi:hypothetical protein